ncbi:MAG TPA: cytochrome c [Candidatus Polarisedimenticolia bacterium]|nr:cytochrome c [Candidatus Polarisedimenticolia bacterium]
MIDRRSILMAVVMIALVALALPASLPASSAGEETKPSDTRQSELPKPLVIPPEARKRENPVPNVKEAIEAGGAVFSSQCAMCHGENGKGRGELALSLQMKVPDLTDPKLQQKRTDGDFFYIIATGHGQMPGEKRLPENNLWEMIRFIRTLHP